jgi:hypothetical protein
MPALEIGKPFPGLSFPTADAGEYLYTGAGHELRIFWSRPSAREIESVRKGVAEFGLLYEEGLICLAYRFGGSSKPVSEAMYSWHLVPVGKRQIPPGEDEGPSESRALLTVVLIDAATGIVRVLRAVTFSPEFTHELHDRIREQAAGAPIDVQEYARRARRIQARYPTSEALLAAASVRTEGGG